jgi:hypothetical protein
LRLSQSASIIDGVLGMPAITASSGVFLLVGRDRDDKLTGPRWPTRLFGSALSVEGIDTQLLSLETSILCLRPLQRVTAKIGI